MGNIIVTFIWAYSPQDGLPEEHVCDILLQTPSLTCDADLIVAGDFTRYISQHNNGFHNVHRSYGYGIGNVTDVRLLGFCDAAEPTIYTL